MHKSPTNTQPRKFGKYDIISEIGRGGMGQVFKGYNAELKRYVAIKILQKAEMDEQGISRFIREAQTIAKLKHPNIIAVYDYGRCNGYPFIAIEYISGGSLTDLIKKGSLTHRQIAQIMIKIANAMHYSHQQGVIHRDLKPDNILMDHMEPRITDFGIAKVIDAEKKLSKTGTVLGSPEYMPPEQAQGKLRAVDERSDVYSMGAVLYDMLVGHPPFLGKSSLEVLMLVANERPTPPSKIKSRVPKNLESICLKALEKKKSNRYQSAEKLAQDLSSFLDGGAIAAKRYNFGRVVVQKAGLYKQALLTSFLFLCIIFVMLPSATPYTKFDTKLIANKGSIRCEISTSNDDIEKVFINGQTASWQPHTNSFHSELLAQYGKNNLHFHVLYHNGKWKHVQKNITRPRSQQNFMYLYNPQRSTTLPISKFQGALTNVYTHETLNNEIIFTPAIIDNVAYFGSSDNHAYAWDLKAKKMKWKFLTSLDIIFTMVAQGVVLCSSDDRYLYALDMHNGSLLWKIEMPERIFLSPLIVKEHAYIAVQDTVYKVNLHTGKKSTLFQVPQNQKSGIVISSSPAYSGKHIFVRSSEIVYMVSLSGEMLRKTSIPQYSNPKPVTRSLYYRNPKPVCDVIHEDFLYVNLGKTVAKLNIKTGKRAMIYDIKCDVSSSIAVHNNKMYCGCWSGHLHITEISTARQRSITLHQAKGTVSNVAMNTPVIGKDCLYVSAQQTNSFTSVLLVIPMGNEKIRFYDVSGEVSLPFFTEDRLYFTSGRNLNTIK